MKKIEEFEAIDSINRISDTEFELLRPQIRIFRK